MATSVEFNAETKTCNNCRHSYTKFMVFGYRFCNSPHVAVDLVTGKREEFCHNERRFSLSITCGSKGRFFVPK